MFREIVFAISARFRHSNFGIKGGTIHLLLLFILNYCYVTKMCIGFLLVKMKGKINKGMAKKLKKSENLKSKSGANQLTLKIDCEKNFKKNGSNSFQ